MPGVAWPGPSNSGGGGSGGQPGLILRQSKIRFGDPRFFLDPAPWILGLEAVRFVNVFSRSGRKLDFKKNLKIFL